MTSSYKKTIFLLKKLFRSPNLSYNKNRDNDFIKTTFNCTDGTNILESSDIHQALSATSTKTATTGNIDVIAL